MKIKLHFGFTFILFALSYSLHAQQKITDLFLDSSPTENIKLTSKTTEVLRGLSSAKMFSINENRKNDIIDSGGDLILRFQAKDQIWVLELKESQLYSNNYKVTDSNGGEVKVNKVRFYRGNILGEANSFVTLCVSESGIEGLISSDTVNYTLGKLNDAKSNLHVIYKTGEAPQQLNFECTEVEITPEMLEINSSSNENRKTIFKSVSGCRAVEVYFVADYATYQSFGNSAVAVSAYINNLFNNVSFLYEREGVNVVLNGIRIVTNAANDYTGANASAVLNSFSNFDFSHTGADLAHLVSTRNLGGGIAYYSPTPSVFGGMNYSSVLQSCTRDLAYGVSGNMTPPISPLPNYSWNVNVIAHEIGHNLGLPHTHSCLWPGGAIDGCSTLENSPCNNPGYPSDGGTIMSYCHLQGVSINFSKGFGQIPGNKLRAEVGALACLGGSASSVPIVVSASRCDSGTLTLNASGCSGVYNWFSAKDGGPVLGTGNSFTTSTLASTTSYFVNCNSPENCSGTRVEVQAIIEASLPEVVVSKACGTNQKVTLTASGCLNGVIEWYNTSSGGSLISSGSSYTTPAMNGTASYYVLCKMPFCQSERVEVVAIVEPVCYCAAQTLDCNTFKDQITLVRISSDSGQLLNNASYCSPSGYGNYTLINTNLTIGQSYSITINNPGLETDGARAWIDFNGNRVFESSEMIFSKSSSIWTTETQSFTVLPLTTPKTIRMRVKLEYGRSLIDPCNNVNAWGEIEDYTITLIPAALPCQNIITLTNPGDNLSSGIHIRKASATIGIINATNKLSGFANVTYESKAINLNPGFTADLGSIFLAKTGGCN